MTKKQDPAASPATQARVLADMPHIGASNGDILVSTAEHIQALHLAHQVDSDPAAVAYAESIGAKVVALPAA
jgi:hypothetical protein